MDLDLTLLFQLALFLVVLVALNRLLFKPLLAVMDAREKKLSGMKAEIERLEHEAKKDLEVYQTRMREARDLAQKEREALVGAGREEERRMLTAVRADIAKALNEARDEVSRAELEARKSLDVETSDLARRLVEKVLGREVTR